MIILPVPTNKCLRFILILIYLDTILYLITLNLENVKIPFYGQRIYKGFFSRTLRFRKFDDVIHIHLV
jgi:hypothetical protein